MRSEGTENEADLQRRAERQPWSKLRAWWRALRPGSGAGAVSLVMGLVVMLAWWFDSRALVQLHSRFAPMQFNTALCFAVAGTGLLLHPYWRRVTMLAGCWVALWGTLTFFQYLGDIDLGIDQLFLEHHVLTRTSHAGRMAPNTALCFALTGAALVLLGLYRGKRWRAGLVATLMTPVGALGLLSLSAYAAGVESVYGWGWMTAMALHSSLGMVLLAIGLIRMAVHKAAPFRAGPPVWLAVPVAALSVTLVFATWQALQTHALLLRTQALSRSLSHLGEEEFLAADRMALRLDQQGASNSVWQREGRGLLRDLPGLAGIFLVKHGHARWIANTLSSSPAADVLSARCEPRSGAPSGTLPTAGLVDKSGEPLLLRCFSRGSDTLFGALLRVTSAASRVSRDRQLDVRLKAGKRVLYQTGAFDSLWSTGVRVDVLLWGNHWALETESEPGSDPPRVVLFSLGLAGVLALVGIASLHMWGRARRSERALESSYRALTREVAQREGIEGDFKGLLDQAPFATLAVDRAGSIVFVNARASELFGYQGANLVGQSVEVLVPSAMREHHSMLRHDYQRVPAARRMAEGRVLLAQRRDGTCFPAEISLSPASICGQPQVVVAVGDLTARRQAEEVQAAQRAALERAVGQKTHELTLANRELQRSNAELEQFAYVASHDLQEPLRMVQSYAQLLERRYRDKLDESANTFIGFAVDGARRMQQLIDALLSLSRIQRQAVVKELVDLNQVFDEAVQNSGLAIEESSATVTRTELPKVAGNRTQLLQLFQNLLGNALKFRSEKPPRVHVGCIPKATEWEFSVEDNGIGVAPEYRERIFVIFQRLGRERPGTGIGLAVCKKVVETHGGRIWVEAGGSGGSVFRFTLPVDHGGARVLESAARHIGACPMGPVNSD